MTTDYTPKLGSLADRVINFFRAAPDEELTRRDIGDKFGVAQSSVDTCLSTAVSAGLVASKNSEDMMRVWCAGPNLVGLAAIPVFLKPGPKRVMASALPPLQIDAITIESNVPRPAARVGQQPIYSLLMDQMQPGNSVTLPLLHAKRMVGWAKKRAKDHNNKTRWSIRKLDADTARVWRDC